MRFYANGPDIPDELLEACDNGNVVFFCGAGISMPAGFPSFSGLTETIINELSVPEDAKSRRVFDANKVFARLDIEIDADKKRLIQEELNLIDVPLDQVFGLLQDEYGKATIENLVAKILSQKNSAHTTDYHKTILNLSRNAEGKAQIVTTNFDLLFEEASDSLTYYVPPSLPDIASGHKLDGVVYLHGRINEQALNSRQGQGFVLSSSDFGRAYLADGWATRFVRNLLNNYTIVLLGYSAGDPPVRYLLEGLHSRSDGNRHSIYAFDEGTEEDVKEKWQNRGVHAIAYPQTKNHSALWESLKAWSKRVEKPEAWKQSVVEMACTSPKELEAHQRGQVASLIRTVEGASFFARANPVPTPEWLAVFDRNIRFGEKTYIPGDEFDPYEAYRLDSDLPRVDKGDVDENQAAENFLQGLNRDEVRTSEISLLWNGTPLPKRLENLVFWIVKHLDNPITLWWASRYRLHPRVCEIISHHLDKLNPKAYKAWSLLFETYEAKRSDHNRDVYDFKERLKKMGWCNTTLRDFERVSKPYLKARKAFSLSAYMPVQSWDELKIKDVVDFEVKFPHLDSKLFTSEYLPEIVKTLRRGLETAASLLDDIETLYWQTGSFYPEENSSIDEADGYLSRFLELFEQLVSATPEIAKNEVLQWSEKDSYFFNKLKIYVLKIPELFSGKEVVDHFLKISDRTFWKWDSKRELLFTLKARWSDIPVSSRRKLENRILNGPSPLKDEGETEYKKRKAVASAIRLGWLQNNGCKLSDATIKKLKVLREVDSEWRPEWDGHAADSSDSKIGSIITDPDPSKLKGVPIPQVIKKAKELHRRDYDSFTEIKPFQGLVEKNTRKAVLALCYAKRHKEYPKEFWYLTLSNWPAESNERLQWFFAKRVLQLPNNILIDFKTYMLSWYRNHLPILAMSSRREALSVWDGLAAFFENAEEEVIKSFRGNSYVGGVQQNPSRKSHSYARSSPVGYMVEILFVILDGLKLEKDQGIPDEIEMRLKRLFKMPGEGADHAACEISMHVCRLEYIDPEWVDENIIPLYKQDNVFFESVWHGFASSKKCFSPRIFKQIKGDFLKVFKQSLDFLDKTEFDNLVDFLVIACYWHFEDETYVSFKECKNILRNIGDRGRERALRKVERIIKKENCWESFGKPFLQQAWPKELNYQSAGSSSIFLDLAVEAEVDFKECAEIVLDYLVPVKNFFSFDRETEQMLIEKYPEIILKILDRTVADNSRQKPYNLAQLLQQIAEVSLALKTTPEWRGLYNLLYQQ